MKILSCLISVTLIGGLTGAGSCISMAETEDQGARPVRSEQSTAEAAYAEDELLVTFGESVSERIVQKTARQVEAEVVETLETADDNTMLVQLDEDQDVKSAMKEFAGMPEVEKVQPNYLYTADEAYETDAEEAVSGGLRKAKDPLLKKQWNLKYIHALEAWDKIDQLKEEEKLKNSKKVIIASLDTGIDLQHEDLKENIAAEHCVTALEGKKISRYTTYDLKDRGHGTSVAGVIGATSNNGKGMAGVAAGNNNNLIQLMGINVFRYDNQSAQASASTADIIKGMEYACTHGAKVINMSLGHAAGSRDGGGIPHNDALLQKKINEYKDQVVFVATAGNKGDDRAWYPSDLDHVISVINTRKYTDAWSSSCRNKSSSYGIKKDISAPGTKVYKTLMHSSNGYSGTSSGTSLAAPAVSGVAAMVLYVNPELTPGQVRDILCGTTTDLYTQGFDRYTGYGNVNAYAAVKAAAEVAEGRAVPDPDQDRNQELFAEKAQLGRPAGMKASGSGVKNITLKWRKTKGASRYWIYRSATGKEGSYKKIGAVTGRNTVSYTDRKCTYRAKYYYKIRPLGTSQKTHKKIHGTDSRAVSARSVLTAPSFRIKSISYKTNKLSWKKVKGASGYRIYRSSKKKGPYSAVKTTAGASRTSWKDKNLKAGRTYYYKIRAYKKVKGKIMLGAVSDVKKKKL